MGEKLKSVGSFLLIILLIAGTLFLAGLFLKGATWASEELFPFFAHASGIAFAILIVLLLPFSAVRAARGWVCVLIFCVSYWFGITVWMLGLIATLTLWGTPAMIFGLALGGLGVVPLGMLASLFHGEWLLLLELFVMVVLTYGSRMYAHWLSDKVDADEELNFHHKRIGS